MAVRNQLISLTRALGGRESQAAGSGRSAGNGARWGLTGQDLHGEHRSRLRRDLNMAKAEGKHQQKEGRNERSGSQGHCVWTEKSV